MRANLPTDHNRSIRSWLYFIFFYLSLSLSHSRREAIRWGFVNKAYNAIGLIVYKLCKVSQNLMPLGYKRRSDSFTVCVLVMYCCCFFFAFIVVVIVASGCCFFSEPPTGDYKSSNESSECKIAKHNILPDGPCVFARPCT